MSILIMLLGLPVGYLWAMYCDHKGYGPGMAYGGALAGGAILTLIQLLVLYG